jgi:outer membrane protein OmpA-like peptidoglycan-associated protein
MKMAGFLYYLKKTFFMKMKLLAMLLMAFGAANAQEKFTAYFDFDIDEANHPSAVKLSDWIKDNPDAEVIKIHAYADTVGHAAYNVDLSERRANYVLQQLRSSNISFANDLEYKALGESHSVSHLPKERKAIIYYRNKESVSSNPQPDNLYSTIKNAKVGDKLTLPNLNFYNYSDVVLPQSEKTLWALLDIMRANPELKIEIQGHICCEAAETDEISLKRAQAVYNFLIRGGIDKGRLSYKSFASTRPIYPLPEKSEAERIANRRVEIEILGQAVAENLY